MPNIGPIELLLVLLIPNLILGSLPAAWLAGQRGRSQIDWFVVGLFLSFVAVITVGLAPDQRDGPSEGPRDWPRA